MHRPILRVGIALAIALGIVAACGGGDKPTPTDPELLISPNPRQINNRGQASLISIIATNADGTEGTGTVSLLATAGKFAGGSSMETLTLAGGQATTTFSCDSAENSNCTGNIILSATWGSATASTTVQVSSPSTNTDGGRDAGTDGGRPDAGSGDGGTADAGVTYAVALTTEKNVLVANTADQSTVTATVTRAANGQPVSGAVVSFATTTGSFASTAGTTTAQATTDAAGKASVTYYVVGAPAGKPRITATYEDGASSKELTVVAVSTLQYQSTTTKPLLGIASSGRETSTPIAFKVLNSSNQAIPDIDVSFEVSGVGGASITPVVKTDNAGIATATLRSGDAVGVVIATATVTATIGASQRVSASHPGTPIVGGKPSDSGFQVSCVAKILQAAVSNPPPALTTDCTAKLVDRFSNPVGLATSVAWFTEAGSISSPVNSKAQSGSTPAADTGEAKTTFSSSGRYPPYQVTPLPGEKYETSATDPARRNPRDMAVAVIAVVAGEEHFVDGSGSGPTQGQINGRWDPGEWFTDLGEPLVDLNDNGVWDPGEQFIDTERIDCSNPTAQPTTNGRWDGPNGCWDGNTQLWRATYIAYTGNLQTTLTVDPPKDGGYVLPTDGGTVDVQFYNSDPNLIRMAGDAGYTASMTGDRGSLSVLGGQRQTAVYGAFNVDYLSLEGTTTEDGGIQHGPPCDIGRPTPPNSSTSPVATRCVRFNQFTFPNYSSGTVRLKGATSPQPLDGGTTLPDGGMPPVPSTITITGPANITGTFEAQFE